MPDIDTLRAELHAVSNHDGHDWERYLVEAIDWWTLAAKAQLAPFAAQAASYDGRNPVTGAPYPDDDPAPERFSVGDYRRARAALEETKR